MIVLIPLWFLCVEFMLTYIEFSNVIYVCGYLAIQQKYFKINIKVLYISNIYVLCIFVCLYLYVWIHLQVFEVKNC